MLKFGQLEVWIPVEAPKGCKALGARWVFSIKRKPNGSIDKYRARYVAKGFNQQMGLDYNETYAPTASLNILRFLISLSISHKFPTATFDVSSAYLYSPIEETVYIQPPVEINPSLKGKVMLLKKALYGTKQAARCWWKFFQQTVQSLGFEASEIEPSLYLFQRKGQFIIIWLHVDDGFALSSDQSLLDDLRRGMESKLEIKWSDNVRRLVGIDFVWDGPHLRLNQSVMARQIVSSYNRQAYPHHCPLPEVELESYAGDPIDQTEYRSVIGSLMYLACGTRPDLAYAVNMLARFCAAPSAVHWTALDWLIGYLGGTTERGLVYQEGDGGLDLWTDANWGGEHERSTTGYLLTHGSNSIAWGSKRQTVVAMSTCAAEYLALSEGAQQLSHLINIFEELNIDPNLKIHCENQAAVLIATDNTSKKKTRYLRRAFYFVNDLIREHDIKVNWTSTNNQLANVLTKRLGPTKMLTAVKQLGVGG
jgi:hypothetical protein